MSPGLRSKPPVITSPRTPCSMAGSWIVGLSPQTTRTRSLSNCCILAVKPSELMAPTITRSSSLRSGSTSCWKEPPRDSVIFLRFVVTVLDFIGSPSSRKRSSIRSRTERTPTTRLSLSPQELLVGPIPACVDTLRRMHHQRGSDGFLAADVLCFRTNVHDYFWGAVPAVLSTYSVRLFGAPQQAASASGCPCLAEEVGVGDCRTDGIGIRVSVSKDKKAHTGRVRIGSGEMLVARFCESQGY